jgi:hypothetical protein
MRHTRHIAIFATTLLLLFAFLPQARPASSSSQPQSRRTIFVLNVDHDGIASQDDIDDFAEQLLILRLGQLKFYDVEKRDRDKEPQCAQAGGVAPNAAQQITIGSDASHYVIKALIKVRESQKGAREAELDYELLKCRKNGVSVSLAHSNSTFPYADVLNHLNSMSDALSFLLEQEQEVTKIAVAFKGVSGTAYGAKLGEGVLARLREAQEFEPNVVSTNPPQGQGTPAAEYTVSGRVFTQNSKLWFEVVVRNRRGKEFKKIFDGATQNELTDTQKLEEFYKEKSLLAVDFLTFVRNVADTEQSPPPSDIEAEKSLRQARELLCKAETSPVECMSQASPAADLLTEVVRNKKFNTSGNLELLAEALLQANERNRAAEAFERAANLAETEGKNAVVAGLLSQAGHAFLDAPNLIAAGNVYERLLKLSPSSPDAHLGRAKTYRYKGERLKALDFLLDSINLLPDAKGLKEELEFLISSLQPSEKEPAMKILNAKKDKPSAALAFPLMWKKEAELIIEEAFDHFEHARYDAMDAELKKAEQFANELPESSREAIALLAIRGLWHREARGEFESALSLLRKARGMIKVSPDPEEENDYFEEIDREIGRTIFKRGLARADKSEARKDFEEAASVLTGVAKTRGDAETISLVRVVNHELGKDKETRDLIQQRINGRQADTADFLALGFICNSYNADPECGMKAADTIKGSGIWGAEAYSSLLRAEALALKGEYDLAISAQQEAVRLGMLSRSATAVAHFYGVLLQVAKTKQFKGTESAVKWQNSMRELREAAVEVEWVFDGALRILESDPAITANAKSALRNMVSAMQDSKKALPELALAQ